MNRVVFVCRRYDGEHIGGKRFKLITEAVKRALDVAPVNEVTGAQDYLWVNNEEVVKGNQLVGKSTRGGRYGGVRRVPPSAA